MDYLDEATVEVAQSGVRERNGVSYAQSLTGIAQLKNRQRNLHDLRQFHSHENPLLNAGAELLSLCVAIPRMPHPNDMHRFRKGLIELISELRQRIAVLDYPRSVADKSCFLFCIVLDEMILHSEWGESCGWENQTLLSELFGVGDGGEQFYRVADKALSQPKLLADLLELIYLFLKIGFRGQYRLGGYERLDVLLHQIETTVLDRRPRVPFTTAVEVKLPRVRKPGRPAHFGRQALLFAAGIAVSWGAASYWYQNSLEQRARDFTGLAEFGKRYLDTPGDLEFVYISTADEMERAATVYGRSEPVVRASALVGAKTDGATDNAAWMVQLATFDLQSQAEQFIARHKLETLGASIQPWNSLYRVLVPAIDRQQANSLVNQVRDIGVYDAFIFSKQ